MKFIVPSVVIAGIAFLLLLGRSETCFADENAPGDVWLKLPFPKVEGWRVSDPRPLPPESGAYTVAYNSEDGVAVTVYVYKRHLPRIPSDLASKEVQQEFSTAKNGVRDAKKLGIYDDVEEEVSREATLGKGGAKALFARYRIRIERKNVVSDMYVLSHRNHFVKVRSTQSVEGQKATHESTEKLFAALSKLIAE